MTDLQKKLSEYVNEYNNKPEIKGKNALKLPIVTAETDVEEYRDKIFAAGKALIEAAQENANSVENLAPHIDKNQKVAIQLAKSAGEAQQALAKLFGYTDKKGRKSLERQPMNVR